MTEGVLDRFSPATAAWFRGNFAAPTAAQAGAWESISTGQHALVVAPTGSGKTLAAFLWALDRLATTPADEPQRRCRVLYISPLKALAVDVERNLRAPLVGIGHAAIRLGLPRPELRVGVRSGDTPADERRSFVRNPPDILITTPESLFLLLTSAAREALRGIETVILDEVHAVAGTKRGAHLALSLERLDALLPRPAQRIGLSATVRPIEEVARFLAGGRPVDIVAPPSEKRWQLDVVVPVPDLAAIGDSTSDLSGLATSDPQRTSIWPHVEEQILDLVMAHRSTLVFANSRRLAERLTARLNELWWERTTGEAPDEVGSGGFERIFRPNRDRPPAEVMGQAGQTGAGRAERKLAFVPEAKEGLDEGSDEQTRGSPIQLSPDADRPQPGTSHGAPGVVARAHHGSVSREQRQQIEEDLKSGRLPAVVATSSLELGIDMGAVDLVIQVEAPPSVASGLQRVGRAGHQVGAVSHGVLFPKFRGDLVQTAVTVERMRAGAIEALHIPANPLDVLAQQIVAMVAMDALTVADLETLARRAAPFTGLTRPVLESVLDMLSGRYPSDEFAELRPRLVWDRVAGTLTGRRNAQRLAVTSGGTIPDRGLYGVFLAGEGDGRRVGELDEEMVYESRVGDIFALGTSSWRIEQITHDRVLVTPAPRYARSVAVLERRCARTSGRVGPRAGWLRARVSGAPPAKARQRVASELGRVGHRQPGELPEQAEATGALPTDRQIVIERFHDELGDWQVVVHSPFGSQVHAPWALVVAARLRERYGVDVQAMHADDGMVFRLPDTQWWDDEAPLGTPTNAGSAPSTAPFHTGPDPSGTSRSTRPTTLRHSRESGNLAGYEELLDLLFPDPEDIAGQVTSQLGGSALFAARFRECAGRALLLPKRRPDRRQALWQQRQRAAQLLEVASQYPSFPIVLEAVRECVNDVFDVPALAELLRGVRSRKIATAVVDTPRASPFASSLLFGYVAQFLYEGDSPLAERRAAALALDPSLLADLLGTAEGLSLADLLDPEALTRTEAELQHLADGRRARDPDELSDVLRSIGPLTLDGVAARCEPAQECHPREGGDPSPTIDWLQQLEDERRAIRTQLAGAEHWAAVEDAGKLRDALGVAPPLGVPDAFLEPADDPLGDLASRYARTHAPFTAAEFAASLGLAPAIARDVLRRLASAGRLVEGDLRPPGWLPPVPPRPTTSSLPDPTTSSPRRRESPETVRDAIHPVTELPDSRDAVGSRTQFCHPRVLQLLRRRSVAALRDAVEPVATRDFARFLPSWQGVGELRGVDGVLRAVEQLAGVPLPASALESLVLPARVRDYRPAMLDELTTSGEVLWQGRGSLAGGDGWVSLHPADGRAHPGGTGSGCPGRSRRLLDLLVDGGGYFFRALADQLQADAPGTGDDALAETLWELAWAGFATNDTLTPLRARLGQATTAHRSRPSAPPRARFGRGLARAPLRRVSPATAAGRWSALPSASTDPTARAVATAEALLDRYGVVTRGSVASEGVEGGFAGVYRVLAAAEDAGRVRRGYFVERLGAAQFAAVGAVDRLRSFSRPLDDLATGETLVLAACDPANPYGAALGWPTRAGDAKGHQPGRKAGALVVMVDGDLVLYVERGGRTLLSWSEEAGVLNAATRALATAVHAGTLGTLRVGKVDGEAVLGSSRPLTGALEQAGFRLTPRGLVLRR
ncbi:MAG: DEAD/DEAH box helicase [Propionibacteriaceae bacterium]|nr:DEAD/DEAH box helicase [Propionibacteriaceae bacterium]